MVLGIGALASLGLAGPTGLAFGFGYGYGVRQGYSAFKPPGQTAMGLKESPDPVKGALGAGLQSAEERTGVMGLGVPQITEAPNTIDVTQPSGKGFVTNKHGVRKHIKTHDREEWLRHMNAKKSRRSYKQRGKYKYR